MTFPCFLCLTLLGVVGVALSSDQNDISSKWPANLKTPCKCPTPSPVSFYTIDAEVLNGTIPLQLNVYLSEPGFLCNTGKLVTAQGNQSPSKIRLRGGIFGAGAEYIAAQVQYFWTNSKISPFGAVIDGKTTKLQVAVVYYNSLYKSLNNSLNYRDGTAVLLIKISVTGHIPNPDFSGLIKALKNITTAGSCSPTTAADTIAPVINPNGLKIYYAYPGSNYEFFEPEPKQSDSATIIVYHPDEGNWMSIDQYLEFTKLKNKEGSPVDSSITSYDLMCRTLVSASGINLTMYP